MYEATHKEKSLETIIKYCYKRQYIFTTKLRDDEVEEGCQEISFMTERGIRKVRFSKKRRGLILMISQSLVIERKKAKEERDDYDVGDPLYNYYNILQDMLKKI